MGRPAPMPHSIPLWLETQGTGFESQSGRMFVIVVVHIQCSELSECLECAVLSMLLYTIKNPWSHSIRVGHSPGLPTSSFLLSRYCHNCAESDVKQYSLTPAIAHGLVNLNQCWANRAKTRYSTNVGSMLAQRRRRWANISPTLVHCLVFAWKVPTLVQQWAMGFPGAVEVKNDWFLVRIYHLLLLRRLLWHSRPLTTRYPCKAMRI